MACPPDPCVRAGLAAPPGAGAQDLKLGEKIEGPFQVVGDEVEYQADRDAYVARGNVVITQSGRKLTADRVLYSNKTGVGIATGVISSSRSSRARWMASLASVLTRSPAGFCSFDGATTSHRIPAAVRCRYNPKPVGPAS